MRPMTFQFSAVEEFGDFLADPFMLLRVADDAAAAYGVAAGFELGFDEGEEFGSGFNEGERFRQGEFQGDETDVADDEIDFVFEMTGGEIAGVEAFDGRYLWI